MPDGAIMTESSLGSAQGPTAPSPPVARPATLEERIRRLEDVVATLQDTRPLEDRIVEKVSTRIKRQTPRADSESTGILANAGKKLFSGALSVARPEPDASAGAPQPPPAAPGSGRPWLLYDLYSELRTMVRMYVDRRYRVSWLARIVPLGALIVYLFSWFILGNLWMVGPLFDRVIDLLLACLVYKVLAREAARYRQTVP
jgi:hypothetical protein